MSGRYSLNIIGNIIKYDYIRSNIGISIDPDIYARLKVNSIGTGENNNLWISTLFGGDNDRLNKVAIGTINSNSCIAAVNPLYNFTDLYLNSDSKNNVDCGNVYILGNIITSNNVYIHSNLNINGNVGIGKYASSIRLDVNGTGNGATNGKDINWVTASIGSSNNNLNRIAIGIINSNAVIGSYNFNNKIWTPLIINGDGDGNGCNVIIDTNLFVNSNVSILNGNLTVNSGKLYTNAIQIGTTSNLSLIYSYNNTTNKYNDLYLNYDTSNDSARVITNDINVMNDIIIKNHVSINVPILNSNISLNVNSINTNSNNWITASFGSCNIYDNRAIIGVLNSNVIMGSMNSNLTNWSPLYLNGDVITGNGNNVIIPKSLNVHSNINIIQGNLGIGTSYSSNKIHIYSDSNIIGDTGIIIENKNLINNKAITSITLTNDTNNNFQIYMNSWRGGIYKDDNTSNSVVLQNNSGELILHSKSNKGLTIKNDTTVVIDSNLFVYSNLGIGIAPTSNNTLSVFGNIAIFDTISSNYNYNIYTDRLYSNLTWVLPNRYPDDRELFTYNNYTNKLDWINIAKFNVDYWNIGNSNNTGYLTIRHSSNSLYPYPNNFKIGFKTSNISIGNYIYRRYPLNIYNDNNISLDFTDFNYSGFSVSDITSSTNNRMFIKYITSSTAYNLVRSGVIIKNYNISSSNVINKNLYNTDNFFINNNNISYDIINSTNTYNYTSSAISPIEISFLFIPTNTTNYLFTINSAYYYGTFHIDTVSTNDGSYTSINSSLYPSFFDFSTSTNSTTNILLPSTLLTVSTVYRIIIRVVHINNNNNLQVWYTNNAGNLQQNSIFTDTSSVFYKLTNSRYNINYNGLDYSNGNNNYNISTLLINDLSDNYYYSKKYLTNYSNLLNPNNTTYWSSDKIFTNTGDIDNTITYNGLMDTTIGGINPFGPFTFDPSGPYNLSSYLYNPTSQGITSYGVSILYTLSTNIKLITYGILISTDIYSAPRKWKLYGSVSGLTNTVSNNYWDLLDDRTASYKDYKFNNITYFTPNYTPNINNYYKYFALVVSSVVGTTKQLSISSLIFNGIDNTYSINSQGDVSDPSYFNDILSYNYHGDIGIGTANPKYKLDVYGNVNSFNLHTSGYLTSDNDITTSTSLYSSNLVVYGDIVSSKGITASTIWGELHGHALLYTPFVYGDEILDGNLSVSCNVGIGTYNNARIRLDVNSVGTGLNNVEWVAARIGGNTSTNSVVIGTINNMASIGATNETNGKWSDLLINGDGYGDGANVIVSTNLKVNSNLFVASNLDLGVNLYVNSNVGIGRVPNNNYRLDVNSYGNGNNINGWVAARFGGMVNNNRVALGTINNYASIAGLNDITGKWSELMLNGDGYGDGANVIVSTNLKVNSNLFVASNLDLGVNLYVNSNVGIGRVPNNNYRLDVNSYGNGNNTNGWAAARFGGMVNNNRVALGTINNYASIAGLNDTTGKWSELLINGDGYGDGANVIVSTNLKVNSNLFVASNLDLGVNLYVNSNVGIGRVPNNNYRLDVNSYGNGNNTNGWAAARFGGTVNNNRVALGTINNYASIAGLNDITGNWSELMINGDGYGLGANVRISTNLIVHSNIQASSNVGIGTIPSPLIRLDVDSYGTGNDENYWVAGRFGGNVSTNSVVLGTINSYPCISGYNSGNTCTTLLLNCNGSGIGSDVKIDKSLIVGTDVNIINNLNLTGNAGIGTSLSTGRTLTIYGNITTVGNDTNNGKITSTGGIIVSAGGLTVNGGNIVLASSGQLQVSGGTGMSVISNSTNTLSAASTNNLNATTNSLTAITNTLSGTNNLVGNSSVSGTLNVSSTLTSSGQIIGTNGLSITSGGATITGGATVSGSVTLHNFTNIKSGGMLIDLGGLSIGSGTLTANGGIDVSSPTINSIFATTYTSITGPLIISNSTTSSTNTTSFSIISPTILINNNSQPASSLVIEATNVGIGTSSSTGNVTIGSGAYSGKTLTVYGNITAVNGTVTAGNGLTLTTGDLTLSTGNFTAVIGTLNIGSTANINGNTTIGSTSLVNRTLTVYGDIRTFNNGVTDGNISVGNALTVTGLITGNKGLTISGANTSLTSATLSSSLNVTGASTISTLSASSITTSSTITSSGSIIANGGITGTTISTTGLITSASSITTTGGGTITSSGLITANGGLTIATGSLSTNSITAGGLITANSGLTVTAGSTSTGVLSTTSISASGLITAGLGLTVNSGQTLSAGGPITAGSTITSTGAISANGGLTSTTISASGLVTANAGVTVASGTLTTGPISSSSTITASGAVAANGGLTSTTLTASGLVTANAGLTVGSGALTCGAISSSGTITASGALSCGAITSSGSVTASGALSCGAITASGVITANAGITLPGTITSGGVTVTSSGSISTTTGSISANGGGSISTSGGGSISSSGSITSTGTATIGGQTTIAGSSLGCTLSVTGTIGASSDIGLVSDKRLKTDIVTIDNALDKVLQLRGVYYKRTNILNKNEDINKRCIGVIAQEVESILPEAILINEETEEKYRSVIYQNMVGILIEAIKDLNNKHTKDINNLNDKIKSLEMKLNNNDNIY